MDKCNGLQNRKVVGSNPTHTSKGRKLNWYKRPTHNRGTVSSSLTRPTSLGSLVQLVRMPPCHGGGQGFEPPTSRQRIFMDYVVTFFAIFFLDVVNAWYIKAISDDRPFVASVWAILVTLASCVAIINYTRDNMMIIPALLGAFVGTYVGIVIKKRKVIPE